MPTPNYQDVLTARQRHAGRPKLTPLLTSPAIDSIAGFTLLAKAECLQHTGSFKYRGALNRLEALSEEERKRGVVAYSSGNHAQGIARAAKELGISAIIVMPKDAPSVKVKGVLADGAHIVSYDRMTESREKIADQIALREGRVVVPSFDDPYIIAGQGTIGLELIDQAPKLDAVIICMGGGGMCAGINLAFEALSPQTKIFGAEPADYDDHRRSLLSGRRETNINPPGSLCDALLTPSPGQLTWPINARRLSGVFAISDEECLITMALAKNHFGVTLEPGGSVALAAALSGHLRDFGSFKTVAVILSGGNVDPEVSHMAFNRYAG